MLTPVLTVLVSTLMSTATSAAPPETPRDGEPAVEASTDQSDGPQGPEEPPCDSPVRKRSSHAEWPTDTNDTRLLLGPTARSLKKGGAYLDDFSSRRRGTLEMWFKAGSYPVYPMPMVRFTIRLTDGH